MSNVLRVRDLVVDQRRPAILCGDRIGMREQPCRIVAATYVARFACGYDRVQRLHDFFRIHADRGPVNQVQIDAVGLQSQQALVNTRGDACAVGSLVHLGCQKDF